jgi:hypothetical protein
LSAITASTPSCAMSAIARTSSRSSSQCTRTSSPTCASNWARLWMAIARPSNGCGFDRRSVSAE